MKLAWSSYLIACALIIVAVGIIQDPWIAIGMAIYGVACLVFASEWAKRCD